MRFAELITPGGYRCDEVASALQKSIRRGDERGALHWATELDLAGYGNYVWKRLRIISDRSRGDGGLCVVCAGLVAGLSAGAAAA